MPIIYCDVNLFDTFQTIHIVDSFGNKTTKQVQEHLLGSLIAELCHQQNICNVHLFGNKEYLQTIVNDIETASELQYANQIINIEVN